MKVIQRQLHETGVRVATGGKGDFAVVLFVVGGVLKSAENCEWIDVDVLRDACERDKRIFTRPYSKDALHDV